MLYFIQHKPETTCEAAQGRPSHEQTETLTGISEEENPPAHLYELRSGHQARGSLLRLEADLLLLWLSEAFGDPGVEEEQYVDRLERLAKVLVQLEQITPESA